MKQIYIILVCLIATNTLVAQELTAEDFRTRIDRILEDAATGFQTGLGNFKSNSFMGRCYECNTAIANFKNCEIYFKKETYYKYSGEIDPDMFFLAENFNANEKGAQIARENIEMIFDDIATARSLIKKVMKTKKQDRDKWREVEYIDSKTRRRILYFRTFATGNVFIHIYSDLKPTDLPKYNGCLILYNVQSNRLVSAIALYVYGEGYESDGKLYSNALSKMNETSRSYYGQYEYLPGARVRDVEAKLDALGVTYTSESINPEGYGLP